MHVSRAEMNGVGDVWFDTTRNTHRGAVDPSSQSGHSRGVVRGSLSCAECAAKVWGWVANARCNGAKMPWYIYHFLANIMASGWRVIVCDQHFATCDLERFLDLNAQPGGYNES